METDQGLCAWILACAIQQLKVETWSMSSKRIPDFRLKTGSRFDPFSDKFGEWIQSTVSCAHRKPASISSASRIILIRHKADSIQG